MAGYNEQEERERLREMSCYENQAYNSGFRLVAGIDEVGRGPIAGPVVAAAVILPQNFYLPGINDSKKLSPHKRVKLAEIIKKEAAAWAISYVFPPYLDRINIYNSTKEAMYMAIDSLRPQPDFLLIDAMDLTDINIKQCSIIKGDTLSISVACASIIAKVERDSAMEHFDGLYPGYGLSQHKGYATNQHLQAVRQKGVSAIHRVSFEPIKSMVSGGNLL